MGFATGREMMQGTLVMLVGLSGLGCHNKGCDVAYVPPSYSSCFGSGCYANWYPEPVTPACYSSCYSGGYSGCYGGSYGGGCYGSFGGSCFGSCYGGSFDSCYGGGCYTGHHRRMGGCGLGKLFRLLPQEAFVLLRRFLLFGLVLLLVVILAPDLRIGPGDELHTLQFGAEHDRLRPIDGGSLEAVGRHDEHDAHDPSSEDPIRGGHAGGTDAGHATAGYSSHGRRGHATSSDPCDPDGPCDPDDPSDSQASNHLSRKEGFCRPRVFPRRGIA